MIHAYMTTGDFLADSGSENRVTECENKMPRFHRLRFTR